MRSKFAILVASLAFGIVAVAPAAQAGAVTLEEPEYSGAIEDGGPVKLITKGFQMKSSSYGLYYYCSWGSFDMTLQQNNANPVILTPDGEQGIKFTGCSVYHNPKSTPIGVLDKGSTFEFFDSGTGVIKVKAEAGVGTSAPTQVTGTMSFSIEDGDTSTPWVEGWLQNGYFGPSEAIFDPFSIADEFGNPVAVNLP